MFEWFTLQIMKEKNSGRLQAWLVESITRVFMEKAATWLQELLFCSNIQI